MDSASAPECFNRSRLLKLGVSLQSISARLKYRRRTMTQKIVNGDRYTEVYVRGDSSAPLPTIRGLEIPAHDHITINPPAAPTNSDQTITYRSGGASGTVVATVTITYTGGEISAVSRS